MFIEAINAGLAAGESGISKSAARIVISGGLVRFLADIRRGAEPELCARHLYCLAKASGTLCGAEKEKLLSLLMLCSALDGEKSSPDIMKEIASYLGLSRETLDSIIKTASSE